jgi:hypothetical protein
VGEKDTLLTPNPGDRLATELAELGLGCDAAPFLLEPSQDCL